MNPSLEEMQAEMRQRQIKARQRTRRALALAAKNRITKAMLVRTILELKFQLKEDTRRKQELAKAKLAAAQYRREIAVLRCELAAAKRAFITAKRQWELDTEKRMAALHARKVVTNARGQREVLPDIPEVKAYRSARRRCTDPTYRSWKHYGGRGIEFHFRNFGEWIRELGFRPTPQHSVDRIDNDGHYEAGNVRWATRIEQRRNQRPQTAFLKARNHTENPTN